MSYFSHKHFVAVTLSFVVLASGADTRAQEPDRFTYELGSQDLTDLDDPQIGWVLLPRPFTPQQEREIASFPVNNYFPLAKDFGLAFERWVRRGLARFRVLPTAQDGFRILDNRDSIKAHVDGGEFSIVCTQDPSAVSPELAIRGLRNEWIRPKPGALLVMSGLTRERETGIGGLHRRPAELARQFRPTLRISIYRGARPGPK